MKRQLRIISLLLLVALMISFASCSDDAERTIVTETTASSGSVLSETTAATDMTTAATEISSTTSASDVPAVMPPMALKETDTVTAVKQIDSVRMLGGDDTRYSIRVALLDTDDREALGKACYFDAIDPENGAIIAHKRISGASTISYQISEANQTISISVTFVSYLSDNNRLTIASNLYQFTNLDLIGNTVDPCFLGLPQSESFSQVEMFPKERAIGLFGLRVEACVYAISDKLSCERTYLYLMTNDEVFLAHCGDSTENASLLCELWEAMDDITVIMEAYGIW